MTLLNKEQRWSMVGRKKLGTGPNKPKNRGKIASTNRALVALVSVAFAFSSTTMFLVSPSIVSLKDTNMDIMVGSVIYARGSVSDLVTTKLSKAIRDGQIQQNSSTPLEFSPGSLSLSHAQTLQFCFADPKVYGNHFQGDLNPVFYSDKHKLAYAMIPKSGSSTARHMMMSEFEARELSKSRAAGESKSLQRNSFREEGGEMRGWEVISFVRDPLSRFFSQYDEAYVRTSTWYEGSRFYIDPDTKKQRKPHPFPYLHENLHSYHDYEDVFCPISTRNSRKDCIYRQSQENGTLASRFERFVSEYNGRDPFDIHLPLQVPMMSSNDGVALQITQVYNTTDSEGGWKRIAKQFLGENATLGKEGQKNGGVIAGRSFPRRFNSGLVSIKTQRRICELALLDYCCLNLPLPDICKGKHYFAAGNNVSRELFCILDTKGQIQPGIFPDKSKN